MRRDGLNTVKYCTHTAAETRRLSLVIFVIGLTTALLCCAAMASSELERKLRRRSEIIEQAEAEAAADDTSTLPASERPSTASSNSAKVAVQLADNPYNEFRELTRKQIQTCQKMFNCLLYTSPSPRDS